MAETEIILAEHRMRGATTHAGLAGLAPVPYDTGAMSQTSDSGQPLQYSRAQAAVEHICSVSRLRPEVGIILGSGFGDFVDSVENPVAVSYAEIPYFPRSTVAGHAGRLVLGQIGATPVAVMQGRVHAYEGYAVSDVVFPTRVLGLLGCRSMVVTNAAGGISPAYRTGELVVISDHINFTGTNAALGPNEARFGTRAGTGERFFDMSSAYSPRLRALTQAAAARQGLLLPEGVYLAVLGPSFETPAEIRAFRTLGADLVGMSTVHEVIVARHMGLDVLGISLVTNPAAGLATVPINHNEVMEIGRRSVAQFRRLLLAILPEIRSPQL